MIEDRTLRHGAVVLVGGQAVQASVAFIANLVLVRNITPSEFGHFAIVFATASLVLSILSLRVSTLIIRAPSTALTIALEERYFGVLTIETLTALALSLLWMVLAGWMGPLEILLVCAICGNHWIQHNKAFFERGMPYVKLGIVETSGLGIAHIASIILVLAGAGAAALYLREIISTVFAFVGLRILGGLTIRRLRWIGWDEWRSLLQEVRGIWLDSALESAYQRLLIWIAALMAGERGTGFFFQAQRLAIFPHQLAAPVVSRMAANWFGREERPPIRRAGRSRLIRYSAIPLALCAIGAILFADPVVPWIFGEAWRPTGDLLVFLSGFILFGSLTEVLRAYCIVTHQTRILLVGRIALYLGLLIPIGMMLLRPDEIDLAALALGVSVGFVMAFVTILAVLKWRECRSPMERTP